MIVSYKWLQTYFKDKLPKPEDLAETLTMGAFEVEKIEQKDDDYTLDIDILPNRAHDCLSHRGIAREISALLDMPIIAKDDCKVERVTPTLSVDVREQILCRRYIGTVIKNIKVGPSPDWLVERLKSIGQKSINNIVDATNCIMFDIGQPLHAFDADKLDGGIVVRKADDDEEITTLGGDEVILKESDLVIADEKSLLAIAGVKGGIKAEVDDNTTNIVLEAANFNPVSTRKTSRRLNILTDSSKRFENELTPELAGEAMLGLVSLIVKIAGSNETVVEESVDIYPRKGSQQKIGVSVGEANNLLGTDLDERDIEGIFSRLSFKVEKVEDSTKKILDLAPKFIGVPYKYGASITYDAPKYFDCSSFIAYLYVQVGIAIPRMTVDQFVFGTEIEEKDLKPGDLVFSNTHDGKIHQESIEFLRGTKAVDGIDHCGLYLGEGRIVHATRHRKEGEVVVEQLEESDLFKDVVGIRRMNTTSPRFVVTIPYERIDLQARVSFLNSGNKEDLIEEIGRVYGYANIKSELPEINTKPSVDKQFYYANKIRNMLVMEGFSESYNYTFAGDGEVELINPLAKGKEFLRTNLTDGLSDNLLFNEKNAPLLGLDSIRIFEFGNIFKDGGESTHIAIGIRNTKKEKIKEQEKIAQIQDLFSRELGIDAVGDITENKNGGAVLELDFTKLIKELPQTENYNDVLSGDSEDIEYKTFSQYPFMLRDIAVWTPEGTKEEGVLNMIKENSGELLVQTKLFDRFEKPARTGEAGGEGRVSYAFNLVFQSKERTLTDDEVNKIMDTITTAMQNNNWEVR